MTARNRMTNQNVIATTRFSSTESEEQYKRNFSDWSKEDRGRFSTSESSVCKYFMPFNVDWGLCNNEKGPKCLETLSEHFKCQKFRCAD